MRQENHKSTGGTTETAAKSKANKANQGRKFESGDKIKRQKQYKHTIQKRQTAHHQKK